VSSSINCAVDGKGNNLICKNFYAHVGLSEFQL